MEFVACGLGVVCGGGEVGEEVCEVVCLVCGDGEGGGGVLGAGDEFGEWWRVGVAVEEFGGAVGVGGESGELLGFGVLERVFECESRVGGRSDEGLDGGLLAGGVGGGLVLCVCESGGECVVEVVGEGIEVLVDVLLELGFEVAGEGLGGGREVRCVGVVLFERLEALLDGVEAFGEFGVGGGGLFGFGGALVDGGEHAGGEFELFALACGEFGDAGLGVGEFVCGVGDGGGAVVGVVEELFEVCGEFVECVLIEDAWGDEDACCFVIAFRGLGCVCGGRGCGSDGDGRRRLCVGGVVGARRRGVFGGAGVVGWGVGCVGCHRVLPGRMAERLGAGGFWGSRGVC